MNVSVTPELETFVQRLVESGRYHTASEVVRDGLRLLEKDEQRRLLEKWLLEGLSPHEEARLPAELIEKAKRHLDAMLQVGLDQLERGEGIDGETVFRELREHSRRRRAETGQ